MLNDEVVLDVNSQSSKDDPARKELLWESREENLLKKWCQEMKQQSKQHRAAGQRFKTLYAGFGFPAVMLPASLSALGGVLEDHSLVNTLLLVLASVLSGISTFWNFGQKYQKHFEYENRYNTLSLEVEMELCKPKSLRTACDVYTQKILSDFAKLNESSPDIKTPIIKKK